MERRSADDEPMSALAFKIMNDPFVGTLTFVRVYSGAPAPAYICGPITTYTSGLCTTYIVSSYHYLSVRPHTSAPSPSSSPGLSWLPVQVPACLSTYYLASVCVRMYLLRMCPRCRASSELVHAYT